MLAPQFENPEPGAIPEGYEDSFGVSGRPDPLSHSAYPHCGVNPEVKDAGRGIIGNLSFSCHWCVQKWAICSLYTTGVGGAVHDVPDH
jgi:hypothetical protein